MDRRLALMTGVDIPIPEIPMTLHQPTMKEIAMIGEEDFFLGVQTLCLNKSMFIEDKDVLSHTSNFQIFMMIMSEQEAKDKKMASQKVLKLLFPNYKNTITPQSLLFINEKDNSTIDEGNFNILQEVLNDVFCQNRGPSTDQLSYNPGNERAKQIAQKLMRGRQRVAEQRGDANASIFSQYISILSIGLHMLPTDLGDLTMFQLYDLIERLGLYINWDIDIKAKLAGSSSEEKVDNWMKNIH